MCESIFHTTKCEEKWVIKKKQAWITYNATFYKHKHLHTALTQQIVSPKAEIWFRLDNYFMFFFYLSHTLSHSLSLSLFGCIKPNYFVLWCVKHYLMTLAQVFQKLHYIPNCIVSLLLIQLISGWNSCWTEHIAYRSSVYE